MVKRLRSDLLLAVGSEAPIIAMSSFVRRTKKFINIFAPEQILSTQQNKLAVSYATDVDWGINTKVNIMRGRVFGQ